jgi:hypothetical protein
MERRNQIAEIEKELHSLKEEHKVILDSLNKNIQVLSSLIEYQNNFIKRSDDLQKQIESLQLQSDENEVATEEQALDSTTEIVPNELNATPNECTETIESKEESVVSESVPQEKITSPEDSAKTELQPSDIQNNTKREEKTNPKEETIFAKNTNTEEEKKGPSMLDEVKKDWEKFIGENLISKIGILIIMVGVAIGGKYAIDNQLISPAARIIIGTLIGLGLQGFALKLKKNYEKFSAVLSSGSMAILYFMVYFAYDFYALIPMPVAFTLMVVVTAYTIHSALNYDKEIIAVLGQVGAYVIPFLLSSGSGNVEVLLAYIAIINIGVLIVSSKKYWKIVLALAFFASWSILAFSYRETEITSTAQAWRMLMFMLIYFLTFYAAFILYKVFKCQFFKHFDITYILANSFFFFGLGYNLMKNESSMVSYIELFALFNAIVHFIVAFLLFKKRLVDENVRLLIIGVGFIFVTIAVAICFTGHWITLFWMLEMALLFVLGRIKKQYFYERMSYPILLLAVVSLLADWGNPNGTNFAPLNFLAEMFSEWRSLWDAQSIIGTEKAVIPWFTTLMTIILGGVMMFVDARYPVAIEKESENNYTKIWSKILKYTIITIITLAALVHLESPWYIVVWAIESAVLFRAGSTKNDISLKNCSFVVIFISLYFALTRLFLLKEVDIHEGFAFVKPWIYLIIASSSIICAILFIIHQWKKEPQREVLNDEDSMFKDPTILRYVWGLFFIISTLVLSTKISIFDSGVAANEIISQTMVGLALLYVFIHAGVDVYKKILNLPIIIAFIILILSSNKTELHISNLLFCGSLAFMIFVLMKKDKKEVIGWVIPLVFIFALYITLLKLMGELPFWQENEKSAVACYSLLYFGFWALLPKKLNMPQLGFATTIFFFFTIMLSVILFQILNIELLFHHKSFADMSFADIFGKYMMLGFILGATYVLLTLKKQTTRIPVEIYDIFAAIVVLVVGSIEIYGVMNQIGMESSYKIAMSIYWGIVSLFLVYYGLFKNIKHLRITGIVIFAITLLKIFFIDLSHLSTFAKAIVFVAMGVLLLVASFFYQKIAKEQALEQATEKEPSEIGNEK